MSVLRSVSWINNCWSTKTCRLLAWFVTWTLVLATLGPARAQAQAGVPVSRGGGLEAGIVDGQPYLANAHAVYRFAKPQDGAGIISIRDRRSGRELLKVDPKQALLWQFDAKHPDGQRSYDNLSRPCQVTSEVKDNQAKLTFSWSQDMDVTVEARLSQEDDLLRLGIRINLVKPDEGLLTVTFPSVKGIRPFTEEARDDVVLGTVYFGKQYPSPLLTGKASVQGYGGRGMQFSALIGSGLGFYIAREDGTAAVKTFTWTPKTEAGSIDLTVSHPVLNWGADEPVRQYTLPGDAVLGPFGGDWFDAAQIYRKWAITAPWCRKGPIYQRDDYPQWLAKAPYFTIGYLGNETQVQTEIDKHDFYGIPISVLHAYDHFPQRHQDDGYPEYFPPKLGFDNFRRMVKELQAKGMMVVPYVNGKLWDQDTESYRTKNGPRAARTQQDGKPRVTRKYAGQVMSAMCPGTELWQQTMLEVSKELVDPDRLGVAGVYYDYLTVHINDCFSKTHGHAIAGGDSANKAIREFYSLMRTELKKLNPDVMICGEDWAEWSIDLLDTSLEYGYGDTSAPLMQAVYHGYALVYGTGMYITPPGDVEANPRNLGRWWLLGNQNGWTHGAGVQLTKPSNAEWAKRGRYYRKLLRCHWEFARPYLAYGRMLRPPKVEGELPVIHKIKGGSQEIRAVEGTAWLAPDGSVGVFLLNYDHKPHEFQWSVDLNEIAKIDASQTLDISSWTEGQGARTAGQTPGGVITRKAKIGPLGLIALKLEVKK